jgi:hypothetical protein
MLVGERSADMTSATNDKGRDGARAVDYVKTQQKVGAGIEEKAARAKAEQAAKPEQDADPAHDSPKRHGDKLEHARDAAAGHGKSK